VALQLQALNTGFGFHDFPTYLFDFESELLGNLSTELDRPSIETRLVLDG
jgi:hypothetical protein